MAKNTVHLSRTKAKATAPTDAIGVMPCKAEASRITQTGLPYNTDTDLLSQEPVRRAFSHGYFLSPKSFLPPTRSGAF